MLGPFLMGATDSIEGVWQILYRLDVLVNWGTTTYKAWFEDNIMMWARWRVALAKGKTPE